MLGQVSIYTSDDHTIVRGELSLWLDRLVDGDPKRKGQLFILRYNKLKVFCICEWVGGGRDTFVDVLNLGDSLGNFSRTKAYELKRRLFDPLGPEDTNKILVQADSDFYHKLQDEDSEETERVSRVAMGE